MGLVVQVESAEKETPVVVQEEASDRRKQPKTSENDESGSKKTEEGKSSQVKSLTGKTVTSPEKEVRLRDLALAASTDQKRKLPEKQRRRKKLISSRDAAPWFSCLGETI